MVAAGLVGGGQHEPPHEPRVGGGVLVGGHDGELGVAFGRRQVADGLERLGEMGEHEGHVAAAVGLVGQ